MTSLSPKSGRESAALTSCSQIGRSMMPTGARVAAGLTATVPPAPPTVTAPWASVTMTSTRGVRQPQANVTSQTMADTSQSPGDSPVLAARDVAWTSDVNVV